MEYSQERHKEPNESKQLYYDLRGIIARRKREGKNVRSLNLRETGIVREMMESVIEKIGDIIEA